jgi:hypothetical protein
MRNNRPYIQLGAYAKPEKVTSRELQETNKAARDEKTITEPIDKKAAEAAAKKSGSANSGYAKNLRAGPGTCCAGRRGCAEAFFGDRPTDLGLGDSSRTTIGGWRLRKPSKPNKTCWTTSSFSAIERFYEWRRRDYKRQHDFDGVV